MNDFTETLTAFGPPSTDAVNRSTSIFPRIFLPGKIYEALPAAYVSLGMLFILGSTYIGLGQGPAVAYLGVGLTCVFGGLTVHGVRHRERSK